MQILLIERDDVKGLWPFSETHCAWELRTGLFTTVERWQRVAGTLPVAIHSDRELVKAVFHERYGAGCSDLVAGPTLVIDAHAVMKSAAIRTLIETCQASTSPLQIRCGDQLIGAFVHADKGTQWSVRSAIDSLPPDTPTTNVEATIVTYLWQVHDVMAPMIANDASLISWSKHPTASIHPTAVIDETNGPVIIDEGATIQPLCVIYGPTVIGKDSLVKSHASLRNVILGPVCKVAGELDTVVFHGYASKQHEGFVGHSYLCEWTNLGAGTITSNLLNTYGSIIVHTPWGRTQTDRMFLGVLMGEHTKTAIGTLLMTGTCAGVGANIVTSTYPPSLVPSFMWKDPVSNRISFPKLLDVAARVMERRNMTLGPAMLALLTSLYRHDDV